MPATLNQKLARIQEAFVGVFPPPPVQGMGTLGGFKLHIEDRTDQGAEALYKVTQEVIGEGVPESGARGRLQHATRSTCRSSR